MSYKLVLFTILLTGLLTVGITHSAYGAQLDALIDPDKETSKFKITYQRTSIIEYEHGGQIADILRGKSLNITEVAGTPNSDAVSLRNAINQKIVSDQSGTQIRDLTVEYSSILIGRQSSATIDYKITINGTLEGYNIAAEGGATGQKLIDLGWRGMSVTGPHMINGVEINIPISVIQMNEPELYEQLQGTPAAELLSQPLINAEAIRDLKLPKWHFLFDPTGINQDALQFGLADEIQGFVVSIYTMGESSLREGRQVEKDIEQEFTIDKTYGIRTVQYSDIGSIAIIGFAVDDNLGDIEIAGVTDRAPESYQNTATGDFPVAIIYGMAGLAAVGGVAFFVFSNRQLKKDAGQGQTGIDPSRLRGYQTSASSGGYQTNRGEAQLIDGTDYEQTRSVYDQSSQQQSPPPAITSSEASCGCAASADSGNECDCEMQGQCFCDGTCDCNSNTCKEAVKEMR